MSARTLTVEHGGTTYSGETAERLAVHPETLRRWAREGRISAVKLPGGAVRFRPEDIAALTDRAAS